MAEMTGKDSALFVLTGTMSNFLAVISGCGAGDEILVGDKSHLGNYEQGNVARFGGIPFRTIPTQPDGTLSLDDVTKERIQTGQERYHYELFRFPEEISNAVWVLCIGRFPSESHSDGMSGEHT